MIPALDLFHCSRCRGILLEGIASGRLACPRCGARVPISSSVGTSAGSLARQNARPTRFPPGSAISRLTAPLATAGLASLALFLLLPTMRKSIIGTTFAPWLHKDQPSRPSTLGDDNRKTWAEALPERDVKDVEKDPLDVTARIELMRHWQERYFTYAGHFDQIPSFNVIGPTLRHVHQLYNEARSVPLATVDTLDLQSAAHFENQIELPFTKFIPPLQVAWSHPIAVGPAMDTHTHRMPARPIGAAVGNSQIRSSSLDALSPDQIQQTLNELDSIRRRWPTDSYAWRRHGELLVESALRNGDPAARSRVLWDAAAEFAKSQALAKSEVGRALSLRDLNMVVRRQLSMGGGSPLNRPMGGGSPLNRPMGGGPPPLDLQLTPEKLFGRTTSNRPSALNGQGFQNGKSSFNGQEALNSVYSPHTRNPGRYPIVLPPGFKLPEFKRVVGTNGSRAGAIP